jgi:HAD superfamily hydrolase (TIGR01509 family)
MIEEFGAVIFDCDGVLVDSEPLVNRVYVNMLHEDGIEIDEAESLAAFNGFDMRSRLAAYERMYGWQPGDDFQAEFHSRLDRSVEAELVAIEGIGALLSRLRVPIAVASNGTAAEIRDRLRVAGLQKFFGELIFSAADLGKPKPAPDVYLQAAAALGVEPALCAVVEDSAPGVRAGVAAGMHVYGFSALTNAAALREAGAAVTFASMDALR